MRLKTVRQFYRLVKLRVETVEAMKGLMDDMGLGSLDQLVRFMVHSTKQGRAVLANNGWTVGNGTDEEHDNFGIIHP